MKEKVGNVVLDLEFYRGKDLYSDGDEMENKILEIVKTKKGFEYVDEAYDEWPVLYHLTRQRENITEPIELQSSDDVLEIGSGMGAITGALARRCRSVDCVELSKRRSLVNANRHKNLENINIYIGNFQDIEFHHKYDVITLIGVLEYAYHYINSVSPYEEFIKMISSLLKENGRLYIAIENKLGLKYFAGYAEDHIWKPYVGIEGYQKEDNVKTFTKSQLERLLHKNGFTDTYFYYPFPDYKLPTVIYSDDTIVEAKIDFPENSNYDTDVVKNFNMNKAFESLRGSQERKILANSFMIEATKGK